jgi:hypothetical protein
VYGASPIARWTGDAVSVRPRRERIGVVFVNTPHFTIAPKVFLEECSTLTVHPFDALDYQIN